MSEKNSTHILLEFQSDLEAHDWLRKTELPVFTTISYEHIFTAYCASVGCELFEHQEIVDEIRTWAEYQNV